MLAYCYPWALTTCTLFKIRNLLEYGYNKGGNMGHFQLGGVWVRKQFLSVQVMSHLSRCSRHKKVQGSSDSVLPTFDEICAYNERTDRP